MFMASVPNHHVSSRKILETVWTGCLKHVALPMTFSRMIKCYILMLLNHFSNDASVVENQSNTFKLNMVRMRK